MRVSIILYKILKSLLCEESEFPMMPSVVCSVFRDIRNKKKTLIQRETAVAALLIGLSRVRVQAVSVWGTC